MFGVYDHTNNQMWTHTLQTKDRKTVLGFYKKELIKSMTIASRQIFLILDNVSIHKSNIVKETLANTIQGYS